MREADYLLIAHLGIFSQFIAAGVCLPFFISSTLKLLFRDEAISEFEQLGLPFPSLTVLIVAIVQMGGGWVLVFGSGFLALLSAVILSVFTFFATLVGHPFWNKSGSDRVLHRNIFFDHVALIFALVGCAFLRIYSS